MTEYIEPGDRSYTFSGFMNIDDPSPLFGNMEPVPARVRYGESRPRTRRKIRLCQRTGHPAERLRPEIITAATVVSRDGSWGLDLESDNAKMGHWCTRCGASVA